MNLSLIYIGCDNLTFPKEFCSIFWYNTEFINNWISKNVRKLKISTDGFNRIIVFVTKNESSYKTCTYLSTERLQIKTHWTDQDIEKYLATSNEHERIMIYLNTLKEGLVRASKHYEIHIDKLLGLLDEFERIGCKNEWLLRSMILKEWNVRLKFTCQLTTSDFRLLLTLYDKKKNVISQKVVFCIYPDKTFWGHNIRKVVIEENKLYINNFLDKHFLSFDLNKLKEGIIEETLLDEHIKQYLYEANVEEYNKIKWLHPASSFLS